MSEQQQMLALAAAAQATEANGELIRFAREGASWPGPFGEVEVVEKLADALKMAIEVETKAGTADPTTQEDRAHLYGALIDYLEGWVG